MVGGFFAIRVGFFGLLRCGVVAQGSREVARRRCDEEGVTSYLDIKLGCPVAQPEKAAHQHGDAENAGQNTSPTETKGRSFDSHIRIFARGSRFGNRQLTAIPGSALP